MKVILDTNFLMAVTQFKIDVFDQLRGHELYTIDQVIDELIKKSMGNSRDSKSARMGMDIVKSKGLKVLKSKERNADMSLLEYSKKGYTIATQDIKLRKSVKEAGGRVIFIRQKKYVLFE